jgi:hypothetical protein
VASVANLVQPLPRAAQVGEIFGEGAELEHEL